MTDREHTPAKYHPADHRASTEPQPPSRVLLPLELVAIYIGIAVFVAGFWAVAWVLFTYLLPGGGS